MKPYALIVDDNRLIANSLVQMLEMLGFEAHAAYGSPAALQQLTQRVPDLLLLDIHMQGINGVEVCRYIRREPRLARVVVLAISSDNQPAIVEGVRAAGANAFLAKPISLEALEQALRDIAIRMSETTRVLGKEEPDAPPQTRPHQN